MPWRTTDLPQQREEFAKRALARDQSFCALCIEYRISRQTGYKWLARFRSSEGPSVVLADRSTRPHHIPFKKDSKVEDRVLSLRSATQQGAKKLAQALRQEGLSISHSTVHRILRGHGRIVERDPHASAWINQVLVAADPLMRIEREVPSVLDPDGFAEHLRRGSLRDRKKATAVLGRLRGIRLSTVARCLDLTPHSVIRYTKTFATGGVKALFHEKKSKINDEPYRESIFALLHTPPSAYNINRTTWKMDDLHRVLAEKGQAELFRAPNPSHNQIRPASGGAAPRWCSTSATTPNTRSQVGGHKAHPFRVESRRGCFSIDEYGPFAVKMKGGKKRVAPEQGKNTSFLNGRNPRVG